MKQALAASAIPVPENTGNGPKRQPAHEQQHQQRNAWGGAPRRYPDTAAQPFPRPILATRRRPGNAGTGRRIRTATDTHRDTLDGRERRVREGQPGHAEGSWGPVIPRHSQRSKASGLSKVEAVPGNRTTHELDQRPAAA